MKDEFRISRSQSLSLGGGLGWEKCHEFHYSNFSWVAMTKTNYSFWKMRRHNMMDGAQNGASSNNFLSKQTKILEHISPKYKFYHFVSHI